MNYKQNPLVSWNIVPILIKNRKFVIFYFQELGLSKITSVSYSPPTAAAIKANEANQTNQTMSLLEWINLRGSREFKLNGYFWLIYSF